MASRHCRKCGKNIPAVRDCPDCNRRDRDLVPPITHDSEALTTRLSELAGDAEHESITFDALRSTHGQYYRPLGDFLTESESPVRLFRSSGAIIEGVDDTWKITAGIRKSGHLLLTDERLFIVLPENEPNDQVVTIDYGCITSVDLESTLRKDRICLETSEGFFYRINVSGATEDELLNNLEIIREYAPGLKAAKSRAAKFIQEVDSAVAENETAEDLLRAVAGLFADRDEVTEFDSTVANADSLNELFDELEGVPEIGSESTSPESPLPQRLTSANPRLGGLPHGVSYTVKNADPAEVGKYTLAAGIGFGAYAVTAPFSTVAGLAALAAGGAATGAYASSHPNSLAARIDPITLATRARVRGEEWRKSDAPGEGGAGAAIGALEYLSNEDLSSEYAHWLTNLDIEQVQRGAELAAREANRREDIHHPMAATAIGAGIGGAYGYMGDNQLEEIQGILDDDLAKALDEGENERD